jgi:hypothetical protein
MSDATRDALAVEDGMRLTVVAQRSHQPIRGVFLHIYVYIPILLFNNLSGEFTAASVFLYSFSWRTVFVFCLQVASDIFYI